MDKNNNETTKQISNIKILTGAGNRTRDLSHPNRMRYLWTTALELERYGHYTYSIDT